MIDRFLDEDIQDGDHTSLSTIEDGTEQKARLLVKDEGILAGVELAAIIFNRVDSNLVLDVLLQDGCQIKHGDVAFFVEGSAQSILTAERLVLNCMQRMSGIATETKKYADALIGLHTQVLDTRKTTPGLRDLEKWAVRIGGGTNHRMGLYDMIMIKDNHVDFAGGIPQAIDRVQSYLAEKDLELKVEIEVRNFDELNQVLNHGKVDRIMLDNFETKDLFEAVKIIDGRYETEASGGITLETLREKAESGVDYISVGALTHSIRSLDLSLKAVKS